MATSESVRFVDIVTARSDYTKFDVVFVEALGNKDPGQEHFVYYE